jgi:dihydropteroate synthase
MTAADRIATPPAPTQIGPRLFEWGTRTFVMGIVNVTPDSFSGDGLLAPDATRGDAFSLPADTPVDLVEIAVLKAIRMVTEGADILDVGGESTRPGHAEVPPDEEAARVVPVIAAIRAALPEVPISIDTSKASVAAQALDAGASLLNDVWGVSPDDSMARLAASRSVPMVVMHNRAEAVYSNFIEEVLADLRAAIDRAVGLGCAPESLIVDPGFGFGKTPEHNLVVLRELGRLREPRRPILLGTSRKSTIGRVLGGAPVENRLEGTLATTAIGASAGADIIRVHDVLANVRAARVTDAVFRGGAL